MNRGDNSTKDIIYVYNGMVYLNSMIKYRGYTSEDLVKFNKEINFDSINYKNSCLNQLHDEQKITWDEFVKRKNELGAEFMYMQDKQEWFKKEYKIKDTVYFDRLKFTSFGDFNDEAWNKSKIIRGSIIPIFVIKDAKLKLSEKRKLMVIYKKFADEKRKNFNFLFVTRFIIVFDDREYRRQKSSNSEKSFRESLIKRNNKMTEAIKKLLGKKVIVEAFSIDELRSLHYKFSDIWKKKKCSILSSDEVGQLENGPFKFTEFKRLVRVKYTDPICKYMGATPGNVIKMNRPSESGGRICNYKFVF